jgi:hypothetical protein
MGAYYNGFGSSIGAIAGGRPVGYGEYMAYDGNIIGVGINLWQPSGASTMKIFVCNYTTAILGGGGYYNFGNTTGGGAIGATGSISHNNSYLAAPFGISAGIGQTSGVAFPPIAFSPGDYIGIFADGSPSGPGGGLSIAIEGTIYLQIK